MYVATVPNRDSPPAILLRESYREDGRVKTRTLANLSHLHAHQIEALRSALAGSLPAAGSPLPDSFFISRSLPHGHAAAVLGCLRNLQLESILDPLPSRHRDLVLAMIAARILDPASKLATARDLHSDTLHSSLGALLHVDSASEAELYQAMDWLLPRQSRIEQELAKRQLSNGGLVLYDLTSTYFEGRHCPLAKLGHSRDNKSGNPQIVFGLLTNAQGCPVAVEVFSGNTADPKTVVAQVDKLRQRFALSDVVLVGDRGMITSARIRQDLPAEHGIQWISALRANQIQKLARDGQLQMSFFDKTDLVEIAHPDFPGERLIACFNPLLAEERSRKRPDLLAATEKQLEKIAAATRRPKRPLRERAFRSLKTIDLHVRPIHHRLADRVRAHILLCMLAYYVEWHMRQLLAPLLFDDEDKPQAQAARTSIVAPAQRSAAAKQKARTKQTAEGLKLHSFQTLLGDLATIVKNRIQPKDKTIAAFDMLTTPTAIQQRAFDLLGLTLRLN
jgi:Transposase DDE domain